VVFPRLERSANRGAEERDSTDGVVKGVNRRLIELVEEADLAKWVTQFQMPIVSSNLLILNMIVQRVSNVTHMHGLHHNF
jgi:hypothetical protein